MSSVGGKAEERSLSKQLVPLHCRNQNIHPMARGNFIDAKIVLFIQMQLCDTTLHEWLRHRDQIIVEECHSTQQLNELGLQQCWKIFQQLLSAVEVKTRRGNRFWRDKRLFLSSIFTLDPLSIGISNRETSSWLTTPRIGRLSR